MPTFAKLTFAVEMDSIIYSAQNPVLSVIIPVHNIENYIERCIASLSAQTIADKIEVIAVENGSTDGTLDECHRLSGIYPFMRVIVSNILGPSAARNLGVTLAHGKFIGFIDGDDYVDAEMFETLINSLIKENADSAYCNYVIEYDDGSVKHPFHDKGTIKVRNAEDVVFDIITEVSTSSPCVRIYTRDFLLNHEFPVGVFYEDHDTIYKWTSDMKRIVHIDTPFYHYCIRQGSTTTTTFNNGTAKLHDYFNADLHRIPFIKNYAGFSPHQRRSAMKHTMRCTLSTFKKYIMAMTESDPKNKQLLEMRSNLIAETLQLSPLAIGFGAWLKLFNLRTRWEKYYNRYRKRALKQ